MKPIHYLIALGLLAASPAYCADSGTADAKAQSEAMADGAPIAREGHRVAIHVDANDPQLMNLALNNAANVHKAYQDRGEAVVVEIVTYGPGLHMVMADSPVSDRIDTMKMENPDMVFAACENTMAGMKKKTGKDVTLLDSATPVPSGVVRLMELQEAGYSYIRP